MEKIWIKKKQFKAVDLEEIVFIDCTVQHLEWVLPVTSWAQLKRSYLLEKAVFGLVLKDIEPGSSIET